MHHMDPVMYVTQGWKGWGLACRRLSVPAPRLACRSLLHGGLLQQVHSIMPVAAVASCPARDIPDG